MKLNFLFLVLIGVFVVCSVSFAIPQIPTIYRGQITALSNQSVSNIELKMVSGNFEKIANTDANGNYEIRFETDDSETSVSEGIKSGDLIKVYVEDNFVEQFYVTDFGISVKNFNNVDTVKKTSQSENGPSEVKKETLSQTNITAGNTSNITAGNTSLPPAIVDNSSDSADETSNETSDDLSDSTVPILENTGKDNVQNNLISTKTSEEQKSADTKITKDKAIVFGLAVMIIIVLVIIFALITKLIKQNNQKER